MAKTENEKIENEKTKAEEPATSITVTIDEHDFEIGLMKGRAARKNITKILGLVGNVLTVSKASGLDMSFITEFVTLLFKERDDVEDARFSSLMGSLVDQIIKLLSTISHLEAGGFIDSFEDMLPEIIGCSKEFLDEHGTLLEVYGAGLEIIMFQFGVVTPEASDAMRNFQQPSIAPEVSEQAEQAAVQLTKLVKEDTTPK